IDLQKPFCCEEHASTRLTRRVFRMRPGKNAVPVKRAGEYGIDSGGFVRQQMRQGFFHRGKIVPTVVTASNASLIGNFDNRDPAAICQGDQVGCSRNELHVLGPAKVAGIFDNDAIAVQKKCRARPGGGVRSRPYPNAESLVKRAAKWLSSHSLRRLDL